MKSKQPTSKREFRDGGSSKKPAAKKTAAQKAAAPKAAAPKTQNKRSDGLKAGKSTQAGLLSFGFLYYRICVAQTCPSKILLIFPIKQLKAV